MAFYPSDWDRKTKHLDCEQDGAYFRLVRYSWQNGPIPDDDLRISAILGLPRGRWAKMRPVIAEFFVIAGGLWRHERVEEERGRAERIADRNRINGAKGGRPRKTQSEPTGFDLGNPEKTHARVDVLVRGLEAESPESSQGRELESQDRAADTPTIRVIEGGKA